MTIDLRHIESLPVNDLAPVVTASSAEGFHFLERLAREWESGEVRFDRAGELLLAAYEGERIVAIGGLTADPYTADPELGRLRHLYVSPDARRNGLGRSIVRALEEFAQPRYRALVLRTDSRDAATFYEALGYFSLPPGGTATHRRELVLSPAT